MTDKTQVETTVDLLIAELQTANATQINEKCSELYLLVHPPKVEKVVETKKEKRFKDDNPDKEKKHAESVKVNVAGVQKALNGHLPVLQQLYQQHHNPQLGVVILRLLLIFHQNAELQRKTAEMMTTLSFADIKPLGSDFVRNIGIYVAQHAKQSGADLKQILLQFVNHMVETDHLIEALDTVLEANDFTLLEFVTPDNVLRVMHYLQQNLHFASDFRNQNTKLHEFLELLISKNMLLEGVELALQTQNQVMLDRLYDLAKAAPEQQKLQFCLMVAPHTTLTKNYFKDDAVLQLILQNHHKSPNFIAATNKLQLHPPKLIDDVLKRQEIEIDWTKMATYNANFFMNGFLHAGYKDDYLFNSQTLRDDADVAVNESQVQTAQVEVIKQSKQKETMPEGQNLFVVENKFQPKQSGLETAVAASTLGLLHLWGGYQDNFAQIAKFSNSPDRFVRLGSVLAYGIAAHGQTCNAPFDFLLNMLGGFFNPFFDPQEKVTKLNVPKQSQSVHFNQQNAEKGGVVEMNQSTADFLYTKDAFAALSIGFAYMGTCNAKAIAILQQRLAQSSMEQEENIPILEKYPRNFAALALGLVCAGSCNTEIADFLVRLVAGNSRTQRMLRFFPLVCIAIGLIFLQRGESDEDAVQTYCDGLLDKLMQVTKPDSVAERSQVTALEDNIQLAAYLQTIINVFAYAGSGNVHVIKDIMEILTDSIQGRVAAEEAIQISQFDQGKEKPKEKVVEQAAETGKPLTLPNSDKNIWPGDNLDPSTLLVVGLGFVAGNDPLTCQMLQRFAERILKFGNLNSQRAVPLLLAVTSLSNPQPQLIDDLAKLALNMDPTLSFNATIALGLIGCGTQNFKIAGLLRHVLESKCYSEDKVEHVVFAVEFAFGLLNAGKGALGLQLKTKNQFASLMALLVFMSPSCEVIMRTKLQPLLNMLAFCLETKFRQAIDVDGKPVQVGIRCGKAVEDVQNDIPFKLAGFQLHQTPVIAQISDMAVVVDDGYKAVYEGLKGVGSVFVVQPVEKEVGKQELVTVEDMYK